MKLVIPQLGDVIVLSAPWTVNGETIPTGVHLKIKRYKILRSWRSKIVRFDVCAGPRDLKRKTIIAELKDVNNIEYCNIFPR